MTTAPTPSEAERLARGLDEGFCGHAAWLQPAAAELRRLQADNERLLAQVHKLEMDALDLASENGILKRTETDELEARKPLPPVEAIKLGMEAQQACRPHGTGTTNWAAAMTRFYERAHGIKET